MYIIYNRYNINKVTIDVIICKYNVTGIKTLQLASVVGISFMANLVECCTVEPLFVDSTSSRDLSCDINQTI